MDGTLGLGDIPPIVVGSARNAVLTTGSQLATTTEEVSTVVPLGTENRWNVNATGKGTCATVDATCLPTGPGNGLPEVVTVPTGSGNRLPEVVPAPVSSPATTLDTEETGFGPGYEHPFWALLYEAGYRKW